jgi:transposase-like protein
MLEQDHQPMKRQSEAVKAAQDLAAYRTSWNIISHATA